MNPVNFFRDSIKDLTAKQIGTLAFNLCAFGWVGMNLALARSGSPLFVPCTYLHPNIVNIMGGIAVATGSGLALIAMRKGNLVGPAIALTFLWSVVTTVLREGGLLNGALIS